MELRHLRYFMAVAEELSFTRGAERLHTAQPSLSQQIRQLETELGVTLFDRTRHQVRLTAAGRLVLRETADILGRIDRVAELARRAASAHAGHLSVGSFPAADIKVLTQLRPVLATHLPDLQLLVHSKYAVDPIQGLRQGALDVAFLRGPVDDPDIVTTELLREPLVVVLPAAHPLSSRSRIQPRELDDLPFISVAATRAPSLFAAVTRFFQQAKVRVHAVDEADHVLGYLHLVQAGVGYGLLPDYVTAFLPAGVVTRPLAGAPALTVGIVMATHRDASSAELTAFAAIVHECFTPSSSEPAAKRRRRANGARRRQTSQI